MKKIKVLLSALAMVAAMAFVSCGGGAGDDSTGGKSGSGAVKPTEDLILFEGEKVLEASGYANYIEFTTPVEAGSGYKKFAVEASYSSDDGIQAAVQLMSADDLQASETVSLSTANSTVSGNCFVGAKYNKWVNGSAVPTDCFDGTAQAQFYIQDSSYQPTTGTITVKKIVLLAE